MPRRGDGITKRKDGRFMARITVQTPGGKKRKSIYGRKYGEVKKKRDLALGDAARGVVFDDQNMTVGEYLDRWLRDVVRGSVRESTFDRDSYLVRVHIKPALGRAKLKKLTGLDVQALYRDRLDAGLSPATVAKVHAVLHKALAQAVGWDLVPRNPARAAKAPRPAPGEMRPLSREEARKLLDAARGDRFEALYALAVTAGMRRGELLGLRWSDVDLQNASVSVRRTLTRADNGRRLAFAEPKTKKSRRTIRLAEVAAEALEAHLERQLGEIEVIGDPYADQGLVFATGAGTPVNPSNLSQRSLAPLLKRAGLPRIRFHDLRHTCATLLLSEGVHPKFVQELLGHATIAITLDTYSHVLPGMGDQTARAMQGALSAIDGALAD